MLGRRGEHGQTAADAIAVAGSSSRDSDTTSRRIASRVQQAKRLVKQV